MCSSLQHPLSEPQPQALPQPKATQGGRFLQTVQESCQGQGYLEAVAPVLSTLPRELHVAGTDEMRKKKKELLVTQK